jgi:hypothetical protein
MLLTLGRLAALQHSLLQSLIIIHVIIAAAIFVLQKVLDRCNTKHSVEPHG